MPRISSGSTNFRRAYLAHLKATQLACPSHYLLKFYAAECGLKYALSQNHLLKMPDPVSKLMVSHKLFQLAKQLKLPKTVPVSELSFRSQNGAETFPIERLHEAWRYGSLVDSNDEQAALQWLDSVCNWVGGRI